MAVYEDKLKKKLDLIRKDLKYYQQITAELVEDNEDVFGADEGAEVTA
jgi:hypothetical protein